MVRRTVTAVGSGSVELLKGTNTDVLAEVDVTGDGSRTDVVPVGVVGSELLSGTGLDDVDPDGDVELTYATWEPDRVSGRSFENEDKLFFFRRE